MPDLLVPLYRLPDAACSRGIWTGRPMAHQSPSLVEFVSAEFGKGWEAELRTAMTAMPPTVLVAVEESTGEIRGFCCWDTAARGFLGPVGVARTARGRGIGRTLVISALHSMREAGYGYAVVGAAGPVEFFREICDARIIEGSEPGIYGNPVGRES